MQAGTVTTPTVPSGRDEFQNWVRQFLMDNVPSGFPGLGRLSGDEYHNFVKNWRTVLAAHSLLAPNWPPEFGGAGFSPWQTADWLQSLASIGVPGRAPADDIGIGMLGNVLLVHGTAVQRSTLLPRILSGEDIWCQGFSEPNAGSDLASLRCRAQLVGPEWVIDGQKVWTSLAMEANSIFLLARTGPSGSGHRGITFLLVPMDQDAIEVRPIRMMSGSQEFNEVLFSSARTAATNIVGEVDDGWRVAMSLLSAERGFAAATSWVQFKAELERLIQLTRLRGLTQDPLVRQRIARCYSQVEVLRWLGMKSLNEISEGPGTGVLENALKLAWSTYHQYVTDLAMDVLGADGMVVRGRWPIRYAMGDDVDAPLDSASWVGTFLNARAGTIYAGTSEIQRNIVAERGLGLPR